MDVDFFFRKCGFEYWFKVKFDCFCFVWCENGIYVKNERFLFEVKRDKKLVSGVFVFVYVFLLKIRLIVGVVMDIV